MLSVVNLIPLVAIAPSVQIAIPQNVQNLKTMVNQKTSDVSFTSIIVSVHSLIDPFVRVAPYRIKLSSDASLSTKIKYCIFRMWNAVKAIFNQSEWQCAKRQLTQGPLSSFILKSVEDAFGDKAKFEAFKEMFERQAEYMLYLSIDNKASNVDEKQQKAYTQALLELTKESFKDVADACQQVYDANEAQIKQTFAANQPFFQQNVANMNPQALLTPQNMGLAMQLAAELADKLDLTQDVNDFMTGSDKAEVLRKVYTRMAPHIKDFQTNMAKLAEDNNMLESDTIAAAKKRDEAENSFFAKL